MIKNKIDLHLHLDGSLRPETVLELAKEQHVSLPAQTKEELEKFLRVPEDCRSLTEYLQCFDLPLMILQKTEAIERVVYELIEDLVKEDVIYAEIRFAPQLSAKKGLMQEEIVKAAIKGLNRGLEEFPSIQAGLILCCMRGEGNEEENLKTIEAAGKYLGKGVCAVDLAGAEALFKTEQYQELFKRVRELKLPFTIHAGEADGAESIRKALEFGAKRIGHGIRVIEDEELLKKVIKEKITLEVCPISNLHTKAAKDKKSHPIRILFDMGVRVTINTDNRTVSNTNLEKEYAFLKEYYQFKEEEIEKMNEYAKEAAFLLH